MKPQKVVRPQPPLKKQFRRVLWFFINNLWLKRYVQKTTTTTVLGFRLTVRPSVFHTLFTHSSTFFGEYILQLTLHNKRVLDMGTGSGILAIASASKGGIVTAVDINGEAVLCAKENAVGNNLHNSITFYKGNLFSPLPANLEPFDYIFFNIPFYPKNPRTPAEYAWYAGEDFQTIREFASQAKRYLATNGKIYYIISSDVDVEQIRSIFSEHSFTTTLRATKKLFFESLYIYEVIPIPAQS